MTEPDGFIDCIQRAMKCIPNANELGKKINAENDGKLDVDNFVDLLETKICI